MNSLIIVGVVVALLVFVGLVALRGRAAPSDGAASADLEARRFARLLVAEIKLHQRGQVEEGRRSKDLYRRLKKEVDRAREMYDQRVASGVADHFHDELVKELAGGDASALGADYRRG